MDELVYFRKFMSEEEIRMLSHGEYPDSGDMNRTDGLLLHCQFDRVCFWNKFLYSLA